MLDEHENGLHVEGIGIRMSYRQRRPTVSAVLTDSPARNEGLRPGDVFLDIGAHIGLFTVVMARLVGPEGRVFSFEPTPSTRAVLERTVRLNQCDDRAEVRPEAVARTSGRSEFFDDRRYRSNAIVW
ncbi:MAG: FkbM family methyltransferase, partial [Pleurocapsa sp. SU_196_0]|nr:FkbM family methyltransferase [Pleurocapsa sp. SU_196_0]